MVVVRRIKIRNELVSSFEYVSELNELKWISTTIIFFSIIIINVTTMTMVIIIIIIFITIIIEWDICTHAGTRTTRHTNRWLAHRLDCVSTVLPCQYNNKKQVLSEHSFLEYHAWIHIRRKKETLDNLPRERERERKDLIDNWGNFALIDYR